jgi:hypothetical protein
MFVETKREGEAKTIEPGTEVECNLTHKKLIVTDDHVVLAGGKAWCTPKVWKALERHPRSTINTNPLATP